MQYWRGAAQPRSYDPGPGSALDLLGDLKLPEQPQWYHMRAIAVVPATSVGSTHQLNLMDTEVMYQMPDRN